MYFIKDSAKTSISTFIKCQTLPDNVIEMFNSHNFKNIIIQIIWGKDKIKA